MQLPYKSATLGWFLTKGVGRRWLDYSELGVEVVILLSATMKRTISFVWLHSKNWRNGLTYVYIYISVPTSLLFSQRLVRYKGSLITWCRTITWRSKWASNVNAAAKRFTIRDKTSGKHTSLTRWHKRPLYILYIVLAGAIQEQDQWGRDTSS